MISTLLMTVDAKIQNVKLLGIIWLTIYSRHPKQLSERKLITCGEYIFYLFPPSVFLLQTPLRSTPHLDVQLYLLCY